MVGLGVQTLDTKIFQEFEFFQTLEESNLKMFIYKPPREVYLSLVKILYSNIYFTNGIVYPGVRKCKIYLPLEEFVEVLDLPYDGPCFKPYEP